MVVDQRDNLSGAGYHLNDRSNRCSLSVWSTDMTDKDQEGRIIIYRPIVMIEALDGDRQQYRVHLSEIDETANDPRVFGIILSDLVDHIAQAYHHATGRDLIDVRAQIVKVFKDEDRFKEKEPGRAKITGSLNRGRAN